MTESQRPTLGATRARQGRTGRQILWVLVFGVALVILGFVLAYVWQTGGNVVSPPGGNQHVSGQSFQAPQPSAATRQTPNQPHG
jgi:hypothetical protein